MKSKRVNVAYRRRINRRRKIKKTRERLPHYVVSEEIADPNKKMYTYELKPSIRFEISK